MTLTYFFQSQQGPITMKKPCVHSNLLNQWPNLTKLAQIHHWNDLNKCLDFSEVDLILINFQCHQGYTNTKRGGGGGGGGEGSHVFH